MNEEINENAIAEVFSFNLETGIPVQHAVELLLQDCIEEMSEEAWEYILETILAPTIAARFRDFAETYNDNIRSV